jgi:hypothetical protein
VPLDDLLADREPDPRPRILVTRVQPLEGREDLLGVLLRDADPVVADGEDELALTPPRNLTALPTRFWKSWISWVGSAVTSGSSSLVTSLPDSSSAISSCCSAFEKACEAEVGWSGSFFRPIRE